MATLQTPNALPFFFFTNELNKNQYEAISVEMFSNKIRQYTVVILSNRIQWIKRIEWIWKMQCPENRVYDTERQKKKINEIYEQTGLTYGTITPTLIYYIKCIRNFSNRTTIDGSK